MGRNSYVKTKALTEIHESSVMVRRIHVQNSTKAFIGCLRTSRQKEKHCMRKIISFSFQKRET